MIGFLGKEIMKSIKIVISLNGSYYGSVFSADGNDDGDDPGSGGFTYNDIGNIIISRDSLPEIFTVRNIYTITDGSSIAFIF